MPGPKFFFTCAAALLLLAHDAAAQRAAPWRVYRMADGLAEPGCASVTIGSRGKVIVGHSTQPYATELDGYEMRRISAPTRTPLTYYQSPGGQLWTLSPKGLLELRNGTWVLHASTPIETAVRAQQVPLRQIRIWPVRQGLVLFLLPDGLFAYNNEASISDQVQPFLEAAATPLKQFLGFCLAQGGGAWIAGERGLLRLMPPGRSSGAAPAWQPFTPPSGQFVNFREPREDAAGVVTCVAENSQTGARAIARFSATGWEFIENVPEDIQVAWRAGDRTCWALSPTTLYRWQEGQAIRPQGDLLIRRFNDVVLEPRGSFWLATSDGLYRYSPALWRRPDAVEQVDTPISGLTPGPGNSLWFLTGNSWYWLNDPNITELPLPARAGRSEAGGAEAVFVDATSSLAAEVGGDLIQIALGPEGPSTPVLRSGPESYRALGTSGEGLWVVEQAGSKGREILRFDGTSLRRFQDIPADLGIGERLMRCFVARNGNLWISGNEGIAVFRDQNWEAFAAADTITPETAIAFADAANKIWCATADRLWQYDGQNWTVIREGVDRIQALHYSRSGIGWIGSVGSILRQLPDAWVELTADDGLPSGNISRIVEDARGRLWVGTSYGLSAYFPEADPDPPRTRIENLPLIERRIPEAGAITIGFEGADKWKFTSRHRLLYSYRVDERDWSPFSDQTRVPFGDLSPGTHYFQVRSMDRNGNVDPKPALMEFAVLLPWYKEARLLVISGGGVALALFFAVLAVNRHWRLLRSYAEVEQKVAERTRQLETANRELLQSQKMTALGTLAAGIAHDFNNILSIIKGSAQIIEDNLENHDKIRTRADRIKTVVDQGAGIVKAMLGFSRDSRQELIEVNSIVEDTVRLLGDRFLREVQVSVNPAPGLPPTLVPKDFVQQILLNFIFNAAEASTERKEVVLETGLLEKLPDQLVLSPVTAPVYVRISVQDFGCGIATENLPRIFEPFFTTKAFSSRRGTGLGLSMVYRLASRMEAGLAVQTAVNQGSTFTLVLPVRSQSPG